MIALSINLVTTMVFVSCDICTSQELRRSNFICSQMEKLNNSWHNFVKLFQKYFKRSMMGKDEPLYQTENKISVIIHDISCKKDFKNSLTIFNKSGQF